MMTSRYAFLALLCAGALASTGCRTRPCKPGTVFLELEYEGAAAMANAAKLTLQLDTGTVNVQTIDHTINVGSNTVEIDFPGGYPKKGSVLHVTVQALAGTVVAGEGMDDITIDAGCTRTTIAIGSADLAGVDLAGLMAADLAPAGVGGACTATSGCVGGLTCVDGVCCTTACADQCEACDLPGHEGSCMPVTGAPHGTTRAACLADDASCAGTCDGTTTTQCTYPTTSCGVAPSCSSGMGTPAGTCTNGSCMQASVACADGLCGATACDTVVQLAMGYNFGCALLSDTTVRCWGWNTYGQLGNGSSDNTMSHKPAAVPNLTGVTAIAAGDQFACALKSDKTMVCWGRNDSGQLGRGEVDGSANGTPQPVCLTGTGGTCATFDNVNKIAAGTSTTCAIRFATIASAADNYVYCWGDGSTGEMGNNTTTVNNPNPVSVCSPSGCASGGITSANGGAKDVSVGIYHVCALDGSGNVYCWGQNDSGQAGAPTTTSNVLIPTVRSAATIGVGAQVPIAVVAGAYVSFAIISDGNNPTNLVRAWGNGGQGVRGGGDSSVSVVGPGLSTVCTSANCAANLTGATSVAAANGSSAGSACAVANGAVYCWGTNDFGQLGKGDVTLTNPDYVTFATPSLVTAGAVSVASDSDGTAVCAALSTGGATRCWGDDKFGALGDGGGNGSSANSKGTPIAESW